MSAAAVPFIDEALFDIEAFRKRHQLESLLGSSALFAAALSKIPVLAAVDATLLITGETGTGKELFARALHYCGPRGRGPFVPCNCGGLPDHLFENELFGHAAGAYTDARVEQKGLLAIADGGTLLLDEVDSLSAAGQVKLLRFLQDREFRPLGSDKLRRANVRVLAATNANLADLVQRRLFREDLYHRLNVLLLKIPSLRERSGDITLLANVFLRRCAAQYSRPPLRFTECALNAMERSEWTGNVRELESMIHRAVIMATSESVNAEALGLRPAEPEIQWAPGFEQAKRAAIEIFERRYLTGLLADVAGNVSRAARRAGKERRTFQRLLRKHGLSAATAHLPSSAR